MLPWAIGSLIDARLDFGEPRHTGRRTATLELPIRTERDFSLSRKNPYAKQVNRQVTIRLDVATVEYLKRMSAELGMPYQNLINTYLRNCADQQRHPSLHWPAGSVATRSGAGRAKR